jgi:hypothetical protein
VEAVFPPEIFRILSDDFRPVPAGKHRKSTEIRRKKSNKGGVSNYDIGIPKISA